MFKRGSIFRAGWISWSDGNQSGLTFYRELTSAELERTLHPVIT